MSKGAASERAADARARKLLADGVITDEAVLSLLQLLFTTRPRQNRHTVNPPGEAVSTGGVLGAKGYGSVGLKEQTFSFERTKAVAQLLNRWRDQRLRLSEGAKDEVAATCIQINRNFSGPLHVDGNNLGPSHIVSLGRYTGGELFLERSPDDAGGCDREVYRELVEKSSTRGRAPMRTPGIYRGQLVDLQAGAERRFVRFEGSLQLHAAEPAEGERFTLVWFSLSPRWLKKMTGEMRAALRSCGFRPLDEAAVDVILSQPEPQGYPNDQTAYEDGFLLYAKGLRRKVELELRSRGLAARDATPELLRRWQQLPDGLDESPRKDTKAFFRRLREINPARVSKAKAPRGRRPKAEAPPRAGAGGDGLAAPTLPLVEISGSEEEPDEEGEDEEPEVAEAARDRLFAEMIISNFPMKEQPPEEYHDLVIDIMDNLGLSKDPELRSRVCDAVDELRSERMAVDIARAVPPSPPAKRPRLLPLGDAVEVSDDSGDEDQLRRRTPRREGPMPLSASEAAANGGVLGTPALRAAGSTAGAVFASDLASPAASAEELATGTAAAAPPRPRARSCRPLTVR